MHGISTGEAQRKRGSAGWLCIVCVCAAGPPPSRAPTGDLPHIVQLDACSAISGAAPPEATAGPGRSSRVDPTSNNPHPGSSAVTAAAAGGRACQPVQMDITSTYPDPDPGSAAVAAALAASRTGQREAVLAALAVLLLDADSSDSEADSSSTAGTRSAQMSTWGTPADRLCTESGKRYASAHPDPAPEADLSAPAHAAPSELGLGRGLVAYELGRPAAEPIHAGPACTQATMLGAGAADAGSVGTECVTAEEGRAGAIAVPGSAMQPPHASQAAGDDSGVNGTGAEREPTVTSAQLRGCLAGWVADAVAAHIAAAAKRPSRPASVPAAQAAPTARLPGVDEGCQAGQAGQGASPRQRFDGSAAAHAAAGAPGDAPSPPAAEREGQEPGLGSGLGAGDVARLAREAAAAEVARLLGSWDGVLGTLPTALRALAGTLNPSSYQSLATPASAPAVQEHASAAVAGTGTGQAQVEATGGDGRRLQAGAGEACEGGEVGAAEGAAGAGSPLLQLVLQTLAEVSLEELRRRGLPIHAPSILVGPDPNPDPKRDPTPDHGPSKSIAGPSAAPATCAPAAGRPSSGGGTPLEQLKQRRALGGGSGNGPGLGLEVTGSPGRARRAPHAAAAAQTMSDPSHEAGTSPEQRLQAPEHERWAEGAVPASTTEVGTSTSGLQAPAAAAAPEDLRSPLNTLHGRSAAANRHPPARQAPSAAATGNDCAAPAGAAVPLERGACGSLRPAPAPPAPAPAPLQAPAGAAAFGAHQAFYLVPAGAYLGTAAALAQEPAADMAHGKPGGPTQRPAQAPISARVPVLTRPGPAADVERGGYGGGHARAIPGEALFQVRRPQCLGKGCWVFWSGNFSLAQARSNRHKAPRS